jgi:hypothetical protein
MDRDGIVKREFAQLVADVIHRASESVRFEYNPDSFSLIGASGETLQLSRLYLEYQETPPSRRQALLRRIARVWFIGKKAVPQVFDEARAELFPVVRRRSAYECDLLEQQVAGGPGTLGRVFATHLAVGVAFSGPDSIVHLDEQQLSAWGVSLDDSLEVAYANLRKCSRDGLVEQTPGFWVAPWDDEFDSSRILLPEVIEGCKVKGHHVAMCPSRHTLLVTGSEDVEGLERMASQAERFLGPRFRSGHAVLVGGGRCTPFELPQGHPLHRRFQSLAHLTMACDYPRQGKLLGARYAGTGDDPFVASVLFTGGSDWATFSSWSAGVDTLLPKTQVIGFSRRIAGSSTDYETLGLAEWDRVKAVVGDLMEPLGLYPERYRVRSFPTPEQLEEFRNSWLDPSDVFGRKASA